MNSRHTPGRNLEVMCWSAPTVAQNLVIDEGLCRTVSETGQRFLRFWWGGPPAVVMGFSEQSDQVVNQSECRKLGVEMLKRTTGGGSVLQTCGVFNYSLVMPAPGSLDPRSAFCLATELIRSILAGFSLVGTREGTSDVAVGGRKISGNAQARRRKSLLVHGTLLADFDYELAEKVLRHPSREPEYRRRRSHREFMVTLRELGVSAGRNAIEQKAVEAAQAAFKSAHRIARLVPVPLPLPSSPGAVQ
jgi:lipoate---protein ligase